MLGSGLGLDAGCEKGLVRFDSCRIQGGAGVPAGVLQTVLGVLPKDVGVALRRGDGFCGDDLRLLQYLERGPLRRAESSEFRLHASDVVGKNA